MHVERPGFSEPERGTQTQVALFPGHVKYVVFHFALIHRGCEENFGFAWKAEKRSVYMGARNKV